MAGFGDSGFGGGEGLGFSPRVVNVVPATLELRRRSVVQFDLISDSVAYTGVVARYADGSEQLIFDGEGFSVDFTPTETINIRTAITGGYRFYIRPDDGWAKAPSIVPIIIDSYGSTGELG